MDFIITETFLKHIDADARVIKFCKLLNIIIGKKISYVLKTIKLRDTTTTYNKFGFIANFIKNFSEIYNILESVYSMNESERTLRTNSGKKIFFDNNFNVIRLEIPVSLTLTSFSKSRVKFINEYKNNRLVKSIEFDSGNISRNELHYEYYDDGTLYKVRRQFYCGSSNFFIGSDDDDVIENIIADAPLVYCEIDVYNILGYAVSKIEYNPQYEYLFTRTDCKYTYNDNQLTQIIRVVTNSADVSKYYENYYIEDMKLQEGISLNESSVCYSKAAGLLIKLQEFENISLFYNDDDLVIIPNNAIQNKDITLFKKYDIELWVDDKNIQYFDDERTILKSLELKNINTLLANYRDNSIIVTFNGCGELSKVFTKSVNKQKELDTKLAFYQISEK